MTTDPVSRTETRRRAVEFPDDPRALLASMWPPLARSDLAALPKTLRRAAAVGGAAVAHGRIRRLMQFVQVIRKRAARYATTKKIGRAHVCTPVTNAQLVCRLL